MNKSCGPCASAKLRCDPKGSRPCSRCLQKGLSCQRTVRKKRTRASKSTSPTSSSPTQAEHVRELQPSHVVPLDPIPDLPPINSLFDNGNDFLSQLADIDDFIDMSSWTWEGGQQSSWLAGMEAISPHLDLLSHNTFPSEQPSNDAACVICPDNFRLSANYILDLDRPDTISNDRLEKYARLYFSQFHAFLPILHVPTFCLQSSSTTLVRAICFIGSGFDSHPQTATDAKILFDSLPIILARSCVQSGSAGIAFDDMQALLLILFASMANGGGPERAASRLLHPLLIAVVRQAGLLKIHGECTTAKRNAESWSKWITMESKKRVLWGVYTVDCYQSILCGNKPLLSATDTRASFPSDEASWNALSSFSWAELPAQDPSSCFLSSLKGLLIGQCPPSSYVTSFGMRLLILSLHSLLLEAQTSILPVGMSALEQALQTWYTLWINSHWQSDSELNARSSFLTNNLSLYYLAIHFVQNGRPVLDEKAFIGKSTNAHNPLIAKEEVYQDEMMRCVREILLKLPQAR